MISHTLIGQAASQENRAGMNTSYGYSLSKANVYKPCRWLKGGGGLMAHTDNNWIILPMIIKAKQGSFQQKIGNAIYISLFPGQNEDSFR